MLSKNAAGLDSVEPGTSGWPRRMIDVLRGSRKLCKLLFALILKSSLEVDGCLVWPGWLSSDIYFRDRRWPESAATMTPRRTWLGRLVAIVNGKLEVARSVLHRCLQWMLSDRWQAKLTRWIIGAIVVALIETAVRAAVE